jgi:ribosomal protein S18 acetylase RimI-like enzyme
MPFMPTPTLRPAAAGDFEAWLPLWRGYQAFYKTDIPHETTLTTWQRLLVPAEPMHLVLAELAGEVVGFVRPGLRRQGVGRALIEHVYADAAARGCSRVWWLTHETNTDAMLLYDRIASRSGFLQYRKML